MPRRRRKDYPGAWHHVLSRGIARRTLFESEGDIRFFLSCVAREVRRGTIEVHAFSVLQTHFHLLVRSPLGRLSEAMQRALDAYARWFNRSRRRDGPLFCSRFVNRIIDGDAYWVAVLLYIDRNAVDAGLVPCAVDYRFGSAFQYDRARGPAWLSRREVQAWVTGTPGGPWAAGLYRRVGFDVPAGAAPWFVESRLEPGVAGEEEGLDALFGAAPERVRRWMERKARLADGTNPGLPIASPPSVLASLRVRATPRPPVRLSGGRRGQPYWGVVGATVLRVASGLRHDEIARRLGISPSAVVRRLQAFTSERERRPDLVEEAAEIVRAALLRDQWGGGRRGPLARSLPSPVADGLGGEPPEGPAALAIR
jgi:REP element-mobilizing transposase RayT